MTRLISAVTAPDDLLPQLELIQMRRGARRLFLLSQTEPNHEDRDRIFRVVTNGTGSRLLPYLDNPLKAIFGKYADDPLWNEFQEAMKENRDSENAGYAD
ncbi:hypothetical protein [Armatimonas sp.]|uniref:hypothetical protein n=1 Tax=Armatimonas sp. TaxID=1872638 RepID=UPI00286C096B|nr:hypothetical protein [Armatimonas sp.]